ncbi:MAG: choice-of-anchor Q domain-containing protein [Dokdonella sp.]
MHTRHSATQDLPRSGNRRAAGMKPKATMLATALLLALGFVAQACAANFVVYKTGDSGRGTLRDAVQQANARPGSHTIWFVLPPRSTITLLSGQLALTGPNITMRGPGRSWLTISGNQHSRIFDVEAGSLALSDMTLRDGLAQGDATNFYDQAGGAIRVGALPDSSASAQAAPLKLTIDRAAFINNRADAPDLSSGGAIDTEGDVTLVVRNSQFIGNSTAAFGGAIQMLGSSDFSPVDVGSFDIRDSSFIGNHIDMNGTEAGQGAAILSYGPAGTIRNSVFRDNVINDAPLDQPDQDGLGGALALLLLDRPISIDNTEISHNTIALRPGVFSEAAGIYCEADGTDGTTPLTVSNSTFSGNKSQDGAAIEAGCNLQLFNTTIADNISHGPSPDGFPVGVVEVIYNEGKFNAQSTLIANPDSDLDLFLYRGAINLGTVSKSLVENPDANGPSLPPDTIIGIDPKLAPLADNGGPTRTQALGLGSVAIDAGSNPLNLRFDQRGWYFPRVNGAAADIGAFESCPGSNAWCAGGGH